MEQKENLNWFLIGAIIYTLIVPWAIWYLQFYSSMEFGASQGITLPALLTGVALWLAGLLNSDWEPKDE